MPLDRGILSTIYVRVAPGTTEEALGDVFERAYAGATFVRLAGAALPEIKHVAHTNFCDIGWRVDASGRAILVSVIDNLLKGAVRPGRPEHERDARARRANGVAVTSTRPLGPKFGGELLDGVELANLATVVSSVAAIVKGGTPVVVVHGGGKEIDAALKAAGIEKRQVDGLRVTDAATLESSSRCLPARSTRRLVAALNTAGVARRRPHGR